MGKFVVKQTASGVKFNLKATNGEIIATSEVYTTEAACKKGIASVKKCSAGGVEDVFGQSGKVEDLLRFYRLTPERIAEASFEAMKKAGKAPERG